MNEPTLPAVRGPLEATVVQLVERTRNMTDLLGELWGSEALARKMRNTVMADLFERASGAIDEALGLLDNYDAARAHRFITEFSSPAPAANDCAQLSYAEKFAQIARDEDLEMVLRAARFMCGRETAKSAEVRTALGLNNTHSALETADMAMRAGGFTRVRGVYRKLHNVAISGGPLGRPLHG